MAEWTDYDVRIWSTEDRWVDVGIRGRLLYSKSEQGCGMQCCTDDAQKYQRVMRLCDSVRDAILELNDYLEEL